MNTIDPIKEEAAAAVEAAPVAPVAAKAPTEDEIAAKAYDLWLDAGRPESGMALNNWLVAESMLRGQADTESE